MSNYHQKPMLGTPLNLARYDSKDILVDFLFNEGKAGMGARRIQNTLKKEGMPLFNNPDWVNDAVRFIRANKNYGIIPHNNRFNFGFEPFAIEFEITPMTSFSAFRGIIGGNELGGTGYTVYTSGNGQVKITMDGAFTNIATSGNLLLSLTEKATVTWTKVGLGPTDMNVFINGDPGDTPTTGNVDVFTVDAGLYVGRFYRDFDGHYMESDLHNLSIYNRGFSAEEARDRINDPYARYRGDDLDLITLPSIGAIMNQLQGPNLGAYLFDGALM